MEKTHTLLKYRICINPALPLYRIQLGHKNDNCLFYAASKFLNRVQLTLRPAFYPTQNEFYISTKEEPTNKVCVAKFENNIYIFNPEKTRYAIPSEVNTEKCEIE